MNDVSLPKQRLLHKPVVYFIADEHRRLVKIGTSRRVVSRFDGLQNSSAAPLRLLGVCGGGTKEEGELHKRFAHLRRHGEWFDLAVKLADYIAANACSLADFRFDHSLLPVRVSGILAAAHDSSLPVPELGDREPVYRAIFWRSYLGTDTYGVYDALRAAADAGVVDARAAALAGFGDARPMPELVARLAAEGLARRQPGDGPWALAVLRVLPALTRAQAEALPRALRGAHLDFLGLTPGFDLPAWWKRVEPSFTPAAAVAWGWTGADGLADTQFPQ